MSAGMGKLLRFKMNSLEKKCDEAKRLIEEWVNKQGHDSCWYYPEIFRQLAELFKVKYTDQNLPPRKEFKKGCERYEQELYDLK